MNRRLLHKQLALFAICIITGALLFGCASKEKAADEEPKATLPDMSYITDDGVVVDGQIVQVHYAIGDRFGYNQPHIIIDNIEQLKNLLSDPEKKNGYQEIIDYYNDAYFEGHNLAISRMSGSSSEKITYLSSIQFGNVVEQRYGYHDVSASGGAVAADCVSYLFISEVRKDIDTIVLHEERYIAEVK